MWYDGSKDKKQDDFIDEIPSIPVQASNEHVSKPKETDFNKLVGGAEKGGLLASMGVSKEETRAAANQMSEYESEDDMAQEIGEPQDKNKANDSAQYNTQEEKEMEDQRQAIEDEFKKLYEKDPELRAALVKSDVS